MNKAVLVLLAALALAVSPAFAEGLGLDLGVEAKTNDLTNEDEDFGLVLKPFVDYTVGLGSGSLVFELNWAVPVLPDANEGWIESWQEYDFSAAGFDFAIGNDLVYYLYTDDFADEDDALEGQIYLIATYPLPIKGFSLTGEVDTYYAYEDTDDNFIIDAIFTPAYSTDIGPGTLTAKLRNYFHLYQADTDADWLYMELRLSYAMPTGPVTTKFEVRPRINAITDDPDFQLVGMVTVTYSL